MVMEPNAWGGKRRKGPSDLRWRLLTGLSIRCLSKLAMFKEPGMDSSERQLRVWYYLEQKTSPFLTWDPCGYKQGWHQKSQKAADTQSLPLFPVWFNDSPP